ncbi:MAG TPA: DUF3592 domain-containing protein, partial [Thermoanaerobaculia bacterium]|nr:DUF3592 domain-containing protein [Thermoanaerobaculia bacterium]
GQMSVGCLVFFFGLFFLVGAGLFYYIFVRPVGRIVAARSWQETPCTIVSSRVDEISSSDGATYRVDITFSYMAEGGERQSNRYDFSEGSSSGYGGKKAVVDRYPPGSRAVCYVDPEDPGRAVLNRDFSATYLIGLVPLVFLFVGLGGLIWAVPWRGKGRPKALKKAGAAPDGSTVSVAPAVSPFGVEIPADASGPMELKPQATPFVIFVGILLCTLFWNGIVSVFLWQAYKGWNAGAPDGCLTVFLIPFVLVGLAGIFGVFRQLLVLFNPRPRLTLSPRSPATGETAWLQWRLSGRAAGVKRLRITLEGREEAIYRRGTDNVTEKHVFATLPIVDTTEPYEMASGSAPVPLPADAVPSFKADHNKIVWSLKVAAEIPGWPDSDDDFDVVVRPGRTRG